MNPRVDFFFNKAGKWQECVNRLRKIILDCGLEEALKWGCPCYMNEKTNVVLIHHFKDYCAILFFKGALMKDPKGILIQQTKNVQAARQLRFTDVSEIIKSEKTIKSYVKDAVQIEKSGQKVELKKTTDFEMSEEFSDRLDGNPRLKKAFNALTPGRQRAYLLHFSSAKQPKTRVARVEKAIPDILNGKGLDD